MPNYESCLSCNFYDEFDDVCKMEYEANLFAAELLLEDETVLNHLNEYTFFETASMLNVPAALLDFKFSILKTKGYRINDMQIAKSCFLKEYLGVYMNSNDHH